MCKHVRLNFHLTKIQLYNSPNKNSGFDIISSIICINVFS